jgi:predicted nucleic acid-binding protein
LIVYLDTSAVIKLIHVETGTDTAQQLWRSASTLCASAIVLPEVASVIRRVSGARGSGQLHTAWTARRRYVSLISIDPSVIALAEELAGRHPLSGADALHLASALTTNVGNLVFATWDRRLHQAAHVEGLTVAPRDPNAGEP